MIILRTRIPITRSPAHADSGMRQALEDIIDSKNQAASQKKPGEQKHLVNPSRIAFSGLLNNSRALANNPKLNTTPLVQTINREPMTGTSGGRLEAETRKEVQIHPRHMAKQNPGRVNSCDFVGLNQLRTRLFERVARTVRGQNQGETIHQKMFWDESN